MTVEPIASTPEVTAKVVEGALRAVARFGLTKLTVDDVAREAGISRATLYRYFPGKSALLRAVLDSETSRLRQGLSAALAEVVSLSEALSAAAAYGAREFAAHEALQFLLAHEPGAVLPHLCFGAGDRLLGTLAETVVPHLCRFMGPLEARRTAEWLARIVLSYGLAPPPEPAETAVLSVVREFVIPAAEERAGTAGGSPDGTAA